jgi:hypothetical protein
MFENLRKLPVPYGPMQFPEPCMSYKGTDYNTEMWKLLRKKMLLLNTHTKCSRLCTVTNGEKRGNCPF